MRAEAAVADKHTVVLGVQIVSAYCSKHEAEGDRGWRAVSQPPD